MYESDWKWWSQSTNHWDGAIAGKLEKGGLSYWPEYRGLTKHHNWAIHGNIKNQDFLTSQVCVCVKTGGSVFTAICPSKFGENWVLKHWMYGTSWNQKKPAEVGQYSFLWKFTRFFTGVQASQKKHQCFAISKGTSLLFFPAPWRDLQSLGTYNFCSKCLLNRHNLNPQTQPLRFRSEPSPYCSQSFT
jgi:hypothetical protein